VDEEVFQTAQETGEVLGIRWGQAMDKDSIAFVHIPKTASGTIHSVVVGKCEEVKHEPMDGCDGDRVQGRAS